MDLITSNPVLFETAGGDEAGKDLSIELLKEQLAVDGGRKRTVSKSRSTTSSINQRNAISWPEFKIPVPDPELGISTLAYLNCFKLIIYKVSPVKSSVVRDR